MKAQIVQYDRTSSDTTDAGSGAPCGAAAAGITSNCPHGQARNLMIEAPNQSGAPPSSRLTDLPYFRVRLSGNLMKPRFKPGTIVEFRKLRRFERVIQGRDYYVELKSGKATFRRVLSVGPRCIALVSPNRRRAPHLSVLSRRSIACMAIAVGIITPVNVEEKSGSSVSLSHPQPASNGTRKAVGSMAA